MVSMLLQHFGDRASGNAMIKVSQSALYPGIAPTIRTNPAGERSQEKLEMNGFNHLGSITGVS
jgi:hypothetical protein